MEDFLPVGLQVDFPVLDDIAGIQGLAAQGRGTVLVAAAAFRTGGEVQQVLPGKAVDAGNSVGFAGREGFPGYQGRGIKGTAETIRNRGKNVQVLAAGKVVEEPEEDEGVDPPEDALRHG
jgi:hypothetical protein